MRRFSLLPALMISLLLTGCGGAGAAEREIEAKRDLLGAAELISFTAEVTAFSGDEVFPCVLNCAASAEQTAIEVRAPENLAGIRASLRQGEAVLDYEGVELVVGAAGTQTLGPLSAMPLLTEALREGHILRAWQEWQEEQALIAAEIYVTDAAELTVWFERENLTPAHAEFFVEGAAVLRCDISEFTYK